MINLFGGKRRQEETLKCVAELTVALESAKGTASALAERLASAQQTLESARNDYDGQLREFCLGHASAPSRTKLEDTIAAIGALQRIGEQQQREIAQLEYELRAAELAECVTSGKVRLDAMTAQAEGALAEFKDAITAATSAERRLTEALYDPKAGLKSDFPGDILTRSARTARMFFAEAAIKAAREVGYRVNPDYQTDGLPNLSDPDRQAHFQQLQDAREAKQMSEAIQAGLHRQEIGALIGKDLSDWGKPAPEDAR